MNHSTTLQPIEKKALYIKISDAIYGYIVTNHLQPGDKLPSERDMASLLQTSRNSLREGLHILESRGLIEIKPGSGTYVKNPYASDGIMVMKIQGCSKEELFELQAILDQEIVKSALQNASDIQKKDLLQCARELLELSESHQYSHTLDKSFHTKLYELAKNKAICQIIDSIREYRFVMQEDITNHDSSIWLPTVIDHLLLAQALMDNDEQAACSAMKRISDFGYHILTD